MPRHHSDWNLWEGVYSDASGWFYTVSWGSPGGLKSELTGMHGQGAARRLFPLARLAVTFRCVSV